MQELDGTLAVDPSSQHKNPLGRIPLIITGQVHRCVAFFHLSDGNVDSFKRIMRGLGNFKGYGM
jgi:hypothetical protein